MNKSKHKISFLIKESKKVVYTFLLFLFCSKCSFSQLSPPQNQLKIDSIQKLIDSGNNLSKYSGCTKANQLLIFDEKNIHLKIEDNGNGFNEREIKHHGGLNNMQHRAEEIRGVIKINSVVKKGTVIELSMPRYC